MRSSFFILFMVGISLLAFGQEELIASFQVESEIKDLVIDRAGDFYLVFDTGEIVKYDKEGQRIASFQHNSEPTLFDPWNSIRLLAYYRERNEYTLLSPDLGFSSFSSIDPVLAIEPYLMCSSGDRFVWIMDIADFSFRKVNPSVPVVISEFSISNEPNILEMREYQNYLFLHHDSGISIYNNLGFLVRELESPSIKHFNFFGEELYYPEEGQVRFFDLFTTEQRTIPISEDFDQIVLTDEILVLTNDQTVKVFRFNL